MAVWRNQCVIFVSKCQAETGIQSYSPCFKSILLCDDHGLWYNNHNRQPGERNLTDPRTTNNKPIKTGWAIVLLLILILIVFAVKRSVDTYSGVSHEGIFELRYLEHPVITALHMFCGMAFIILAPLQFMQRIRSKRLGLHRKLGKFLVFCALVSGVYGMVSLVALPAFGGLASETAGWFFGPIFVFSILRAFWYVRNKMIAQHREWMIRAFALGLGVGTQRILLFLFLTLTGYGFEESFGPALWMGFSINLLVAEIWINLTRRKA